MVVGVVADGDGVGLVSSATANVTRTVFLRRLVEDYLLLVRASAVNTTLSCDIFVAELKVPHSAPHQYRSFVGLGAHVTGRCCSSPLPSPRVCPSLPRRSCSTTCFMCRRRLGAALCCSPEWCPLVGRRSGRRQWQRQAWTTHSSLGEGSSSGTRTDGWRRLDCPRSSPVRVPPWTRLRSCTTST